MNPDLVWGIFTFMLPVVGGAIAVCFIYMALPKKSEEPAAADPPDFLPYADEATQSSKANWQADLQRRMAEGEPQEVFAEEIAWECPYCKALNNTDHDYCFHCGSPRRRQNEIQRTKL